jgi:hypothetical protein
LGAGILVRQITGVESGHTRLPCADFLKVNWTGWLSETPRAAINDCCSTLSHLRGDEFHGDEFSPCPGGGRVGSHRAKQDARRGGVISQLGYRSRGETVTPPRRSFQSRRPQERASLVSTPPGEGERNEFHFAFGSTTGWAVCTAPGFRT